MLRSLAREGTRVHTRGTCMQPLLAGDALMEVRQKWMYLPGDVLVFRTPAGALAVHRLLGVRPAGFVTKGDHCAIHDAPVKRRYVVGAASVPISAADRLRACADLLRIVWRRLVR